MDTYILEKLRTTPSRTLPIIIDEISALNAISLLLGETIVSLDDCKTGNFQNLFLYEKEEDKKSISVKVIRTWIEDLAEKPYSGKNIYVLRDFDEATLEAMNASLKVLEEPPAYAIIFLVVKNPESLLETIRSRTINLAEKTKSSAFSEELREATEQFLEGKIAPLLETVQSGKLDEQMILEILLHLHKKAHVSHSNRIEKAIEELLEVHENPRNILDRVLLYL